MEKISVFIVSLLLGGCAFSPPPLVDSEYKQLTIIQAGAETCGDGIGYEQHEIILGINDFKKNYSIDGHKWYSTLNDARNEVDNKINSLGIDSLCSVYKESHIKMVDFYRDAEQQRHNKHQEYMMDNDKALIRKQKLKQYGEMAMIVISALAKAESEHQKELNKQPPLPIDHTNEINELRHAVDRLNTTISYY
jgi:hypothetical protein